MAHINLKLKGDERIIYVATRHWIAFVQRAAIPAAVGLVALLFFMGRTLVQEDVLGRQAPLLDALSITLIMSAIIPFAIVVYIWFDWINDHLIVTNKRVVHEDLTLWLSSTFETIPLDQIQNVNIQVENPIQYTLNYGQVQVQAAGPTAPIFFRRACRPKEVQSQIMGEVRRQKRRMEQTRLEGVIARRLNPNAPAPPTVVLPTQAQMMESTSPLQAFLPFQPIVQNGIITWHRHWIILVRNMVLPVLAFAVWLGLFWGIPRYALLSPTPSIVVLFLLFVFVLIFFYWQYDDWLNDIYILEPTQIVDIQRMPFGLFEDRREAPLGVIQNVNATSPNIVARVLGYGNVVIETAGQSGNFTFDHVPDPDQVQRMVFEYREEHKWKQREREWNNQMDIVEKYHVHNGHGTSLNP